GHVGGGQPGPGRGDVRVEHPGDARRVDAAGGVDLADEAGPRPLVDDQRRVDELDRHPPRRAAGGADGVLGQPDLAHAAPPEALDQAIGPDLLPGAHRRLRGLVVRAVVIALAGRGTGCGPPAPCRPAPVAGRARGTAIADRNVRAARGRGRRTARWPARSSRLYKSDTSAAAGAPPARAPADSCLHTPGEVRPCPRSRSTTRSSSSTATR